MAGGRLRLAVLAGYAVALAAACLIPWAPSGGPAGSDKVFHAAAYGLLAVLSLLVLAPRYRPSGGAVLVALVLVLTHGGIIELAQTRIPTRSGDVRDLGANLLGAAAACLGFCLMPFRGRAGRETACEARGAAGKK